MPRLFVYGQLKTQLPKSAKDIRVDSLNGRCYAFRDDAHLVQPLHQDDVVDGLTMSVSDDEMKRLDKEESPEWHRVLAKTNHGKLTYVYEYRGKLSSGAKLVQNWEPHK